MSQPPKTIGTHRISPQPSYVKAIAESDMDRDIPNEDLEWGDNEDDGVGGKVEDEMDLVEARGLNWVSLTD